jgi:RNase H-fold protein (predicted Holliday junction resolvase)
MTHIIPAARSLVVGAVAVGALTLGSAGIAGAAATPSTPSTPATASAHQFNCANATKVLTRIQNVETKIASGLPKLTAAESKATAAGRTKLAARIQKRITRLESTTFKNRLDRVAAKIEAKCNVPAPSA